MKLTQYLFLAAFAVTFSGCSKLDSLLDTGDRLKGMGDTTNKMKDNMEKMGNTTEQMKNGMDATNESIRIQKVAIALSEMQKKENRQYLSPIPGDMMPAGKVMAESLTVDEALLFLKDYIKKINEENFSNRYPTDDQSTPDGQKLLAGFEHEKLADLMMITIVAGFLPDKTLNEMISQESEQGAYRDILYQTLMLRVIFNNDLMLNASVLNEKLLTVGKINKAIEYNQKVDLIAKLPFHDQIALSITGFSNPDMNAAISKRLDISVALKNWNKIYSAASEDFKATSFANDDAVKQAVLAKQQAEFSKSMNTIQNFIQSWPTTTGAN